MIASSSLTVEQYIARLSQSLDGAYDLTNALRSRPLPVLPETRDAQSHVNLAFAVSDLATVRPGPR